MRRGGAAVGPNHAHIGVRRHRAYVGRIRKGKSAAVTQYPTLVLMVGFNRRFAPHIVKARQLLASIGKMNLWGQDKDQRACTDAFVRAVRHGRSSPIPFEESVEVSRVCIEAARSLG